MHWTANSANERAVELAYASGHQVVLEPGSPDGSELRGEFLTGLLLAGPESGTPSGRQALHIVNATITGVLDVSGTKIDVPINFTNCDFASRPRFDDADVRALRLPGCRCPGLDATNTRVAGNLELNDGFTSAGEVTLLGARVEGAVRLSGSRIENRTEDGSARALNASRLSVRGAFFAGGMQAVGQVRLISAKIDGLLSLKGAQIHNPGAIALHGERLVVGESLFFQKGFEAQGRVLLQNASIAGGVDASRAKFGGAPQSKACLQLVRATIGRNLSLIDAKIDGLFSASYAHVKGEIVCKGTEFSDVVGELNVSHCAAPILNLYWSQAPATADLRHATFDILRDDPASAAAELHLEGCTYRVLESPTPCAVEDRLDWLHRATPTYGPSPYDRLIAFYRTIGSEQEARRVALEKERRRRRTLSRFGQAVGFILDGTVGYGYRNWLAAIWLTGLIVVGGILFAADRPSPLPNAPAFQPLVYAADLVLPIIDFGQEKGFAPTDASRWVAWILIASGWILTTALVAGITRAFNKA